MFDLTTIFWTGVGVASFTLAIIDYAMSRGKKAKA